MPRLMHGGQLTGHGGPEKLIWNEAIPVPTPAAGEVLVRVLAAGVNNTDLTTRIGWDAKEVSAAPNDVKDADIESGGWGGAVRFPRGWARATPRTHPIVQCPNPTPAMRRLVGA